MLLMAKYRKVVWLVLQLDSSLSLPRRIGDARDHGVGCLGLVFCLLPHCRRHLKQQSAPLVDGDCDLVERAVFEALLRHQDPIEQREAAVERKRSVALIWRGVDVVELTPERVCMPSACGSGCGSGDCPRRDVRARQAGSCASLAH